MVDSEETNATVLIAQAGGLTNALLPQTEYYLEITNGDYVGHRLEINKDSITNITLAFDLESELNTLASLPSEDGLAGARFDLRARQTLGTAYQTEAFKSRTIPHKPINCSGGLMVRTPATSYSMRAIVPIGPTSPITP